MNPQIADLLPWNLLQRFPAKAWMFLGVALAACFSGQAPLARGADDKLEFNRDIRPILSENCFACHGPDANARQAGLRLDLPDAAMARLESGKHGIVPFKPDQSEIVQRITSSDSTSLMPPPDSGKHLTDSQIEQLKRWVVQGAEYQRHWSFVPPTRPRLDASGLTGYENSIDVFVLQRLKREGLEASAPANREQLIRRATLDLTGIPPTLEEVDEFLAEKSPDAYERLVDRLMASPRYGERLTVDWLDAARFADTHGFNNDTTRSMWRWRDWTIEAFNSNMPFDQFLTEQLAGDLLPNPTLDQLIATGFNRNHVINSEGGIIPEEYRVEYVADRVHTTATVFLGLSMGCVRCHDHKFDPVTQREYYQFFAFFNQLDEKGEDGRKGNATPQIPAPTPTQSQRQAALNRSLETLDKSLQERLERQGESISETESRLQEVYLSKLAGPMPQMRLTFDEVDGDQVVDQVDPLRKGSIVGKVDRIAGKFQGALKFDGKTHVEVGDIGRFERTDRFSLAVWVNATTNETGTIISRMDSANAFRGYDLEIDGGKVTSHLISHWPDNAIKITTKSNVPLNQWHHVVVTYDGSSKAEGLKLYVNGMQQDAEIKQNSLGESTVTTQGLRLGRRTDDLPFKGLIDEVRVYDRELSADEVRSVFEFDGIPDLLALPATSRSSSQNQLLITTFLLRFNDEFQSLSRLRGEQAARLMDLENSIPSAMVMREMPQPRQTFLLKRGQYDAHGDEVQPGVPASLPAFPNDAPRNRLGLAKWMLLPNHPLTSRVAVNRSWTLFFGNGLVETVEDFGSQGQWPTHLDLLDWLAVEFAGVGCDSSRWDVKRLHRSMVQSATYRQSSRVNPILLERDPSNRLLARGPRFRLQAEAIRDNALAIAGLLGDRIGGPSVSPYQPEGLWDDVAVGADYEGTVYKLDTGEGLYRRGMYTFWKRTCPPPGLNTFDAPEREFCLARRSRTNTPLQALVLMNDPTYLEAARKLAERAIKSGGDSTASRLAHGFRLALARHPTAAETELLSRTYQSRLKSYRQDPASARSILAVGASAHDDSIDEAELAAFSSVMSIILNMDETITKG